MDLLVSMSVIALLLAILLPSLSRATESARRVVCLSNLKQIGLATQMYVDDHDGYLPPSVFSKKDPNQLVPQDMQLAHLKSADPGAWDGLGWLVAGEYLNAAPIFYCPSHHGLHPEQRYEEAWAMLNGEIVTNYQYRFFPQDPMPLAELLPMTTIVSDGLRTQLDYNHRVGANVLRADMSAGWYTDEQGFVYDLLPRSEDDVAAAKQVLVAWGTFDLGRPPANTGGGFVDDATAFRIIDE
ncbi:MAG: DUF1559 domain-containing protein [Planctomycetota bacterium]|nr:MAG: DUF1559 domain-containing protein [Planctomycetota bacterium]